ncbi:hypothetical protein HID58_015063 [Brassica napus]|uniref:Uncharacterized protein n=1 Tax=Brassica napus TaxID=3708 RepID=A0ABQ8DIZ7_BRANA|nr:hypothetical protein HID58_015063 [Brassica napus]
MFFDQIKTIESKFKDILPIVISLGLFWVDDFMLDIEINFVNLENLCDDWGFKENEIIDAHNMLRSTQANLAVLEGKIMIVREKHSKLDHTRRDLVYSGLHP